MVASAASENKSSAAQMADQNWRIRTKRFSRAALCEARVQSLLIGAMSHQMQPRYVDVEVVVVVVVVVVGEK